jgi:radical SAM superfamily enzyme YgiQ (UPF0313 family)
MKYLFVKPQSLSIELLPTPGIPSLMGILENNNIECEYIDLNSEYLQNINKENLINYNKLLEKFYKNEEYKSFPKIFQEQIIKQIDDYNNYTLWLKKNEKKIDKYIKLSKSKNLLYSYIYLFYNMTFFSIIFRQYIPLFCSVVYDCNPSDNITINVNDILYIINSPFNHLKEFYEKKATEILSKNPDVIGIQITLQFDLISGLMLGYFLKKRNKNVHINIGGHYFEYANKCIKNLKDLFGIFFDSISIDDSTTTVSDFAKYIKNEIKIQNVHNIIYKEDDELKFNPVVKSLNINQLPFQSFTGYKKENYYLPELILPLRASTTYSCYWSKCKYCTCSGKTESFRLMSAERFVNEIEYLSKKYKTRYFAFWDNALHPKYLEKVADLLIQKNLKIKYTMYARLEKFDEKLLRKIKKSGCVSIFWGLDTASQRISDYMNKGINVQNAKIILKYSNKVGITNYLYLLFSFPTETIEDTSKNLEFIEENHKNIHKVYIMQNVEFYEKSLLSKNYNYYFNQIDNSKEFISYKNEVMSKIPKIMKTPIDISVSSQWEFLYIAKYGRLRFKIIKNIIFYYFHSKSKFIKKLMNLYYMFLLDKLK